MSRSALDDRITSSTASEATDDETVLSFDGVTKSFGGQPVIEDCSLSVRSGEVVTILGPSGCGKTTLLRMIAGLESPTAGRIEIDGDCVASPTANVPPEARDVGLVFQEYALFPHLTVAENVGYAVDDPDRVERALELVDLAGLGDRDPEALSGGQRQRVALARSLAPDPDVLLLDEPFSNLDVGLREQVRDDVLGILDAADVTTIAVTHDQREALAMSDRVAVLDDGQIAQIDRPERVFQHPATRFVARFLGRTAFVPGRIRDGCVETPVGPVPVDRLAGDPPTGDRIDLLVRPDDLLAQPDPAGTAVVEECRYVGPAAIHRVAIDDGPTVRCRHNHADVIDAETRVSVTIAADHDLAWFPA
ncbi:ABC transporter ATP-binding protein [Halococcoides cellulosivorans]|uniref:Molybdate/tungstate import ATP-binding protein WtpC n=1 Tax=Halococcoides cellulosivorans TaxID=1679096 RepID=A0A2R4WYH3_9EURY|nr:ABC transporter ATP-binding protein [Halococcoides cellulosivorans]AWB26578.1 ABC transporter ATP-binding protein [Halococcoides cellulosivorans]